MQHNHRSPNTANSLGALRTFGGASASIWNPRQLVSLGWMNSPSGNKRFRVKSLTLKTSSVRAPLKRD
jgi:hypothetical protein